MPKNPGKPTSKITPGMLLGALKVPPKVGERRNYDIQPDANEYQLWPYSTIEWTSAQNKYRARVMIQDKKTRDHVAFNSWHQDFADAERAIALVSDSVRGVGPRRVYNIFGETIEANTTPGVGGEPPANVAEVLALIWSMRQID